MTRKLLDLPPRVVDVYGFTSKPESTEAMLLLSEGMGHHTEILDLMDFHDWLKANRPELLVEGHQPGRDFDPHAMEPDVLALILAYARKMKRERNPEAFRFLELGCLVDASHHYMNYATVGK